MAARSESVTTTTGSPNKSKTLYGRVSCGNEIRRTRKKESVHHTRGGELLCAGNYLLVCVCNCSVFPRLVRECSRWPYVAAVPPRLSWRARLRLIMGCGGAQGYVVQHTWYVIERWPLIGTVGMCAEWVAILPSFIPLFFFFFFGRVPRTRSGIKCGRKEKGGP